MSSIRAAPCTMPLPARTSPPAVAAPACASAPPSGSFPAQHEHACASVASWWRRPCKPYPPPVGPSPQPLHARTWAPREHLDLPAQLLGALLRVCQGNLHAAGKARRQTTAGRSAPTDNPDNEEGSSLRIRLVNQQTPPPPPTLSLSTSASAAAARRPAAAAASSAASARSSVASPSPSPAGRRRRGRR